MSTNSPTALTGAGQEKEGVPSPESSRPTSEHLIEYTSEEEQKVTRKVDLVLLPGLALLYTLSFLDRSNIGNAKLFGMLTDLKIKNAADYNTALALYFLGYVLFEVPTNIVLKKLNPTCWLPVLTIAWGITATLQGIVTSKSGFYAARFFMGVAEAGLFPGCIYIFSMYYKRNERHWRVAVFFGGAAVAGAFGGVLAWAIGHINHFGSKPNWAAIFIIEGLFTVLVGFTAFFWIPGYPHDAKFLSPREHEILLARLAHNGGDAADVEPFAWSGVWAAFKDPLVIAYAFLFHGFAFPLYSLSLFLPTIIAGLGFFSWKAQLLTVPPYTAAFLSILLFAFSSHKTNRRGLWIIIGGFISIIGYIIILSTKTSGARYTGTFFCVMGIYASNALLLSWPAENVSPQTKRATSTAVQIFMGDIGAIAGVLIYRPSLNQNFFRTPHIIAIGYTLFGILIAAGLWFHMGRENKRRAALGTGTIEAEKRVIGGVRLGDRHPAYVYQL